MLSKRISELVMGVMNAKKALDEALLEETQGEISLCSVDAAPQFYVEEMKLSFEDFCRKYAPLQCHSVTPTDYHCTVLLPYNVKATVLLTNDNSLAAGKDKKGGEEDEER